MAPVPQKRELLVLKQCEFSCVCLNYLRESKTIVLLKGPLSGSRFIVGRVFIFLPFQTTPPISPPTDPFGAAFRAEAFEDWAGLHGPELRSSGAPYLDSRGTRVQFPFWLVLVEKSMGFDSWFTWFHHLPGKPIYFP